MIIAKYGKFSLGTKTYPDEHEYYVRDIQIDRINDDNSVTTIAFFNKEGALVSAGRQLLDSLETQDDIDNIRKLAEIVALVFGGENVKSGYVAPKA